MASTTYLQWQHTTAGNRNTWTMSMWVKLSKFGDEFPLFSSASDAQNQDLAFIQNDGTLRWWTYQSDAYAGQLKTNRVFRDVNAWYHLVFVFDSTNSTADDRMKIYVNGVQETSFATRANPNQNLNSLWNGTLWRNIGHDSSGGYTDEFDGLMSHIHFVDGTALTASTFGSTDSTTGEWKINTAPSYTVGTKGFFILKDGNSVTDQSANSNNFTVAGGTLTKTEDNPSNVFCTMNSLNHDYANTNTDLGAGNTFVYPRDNGNYTYAMSTLAMPKGNGKFYFEAKYVQYDGVIAGVGIVNMDYASDIFYQNRQLMQHTTSTDIGRVLLNKAGYSIISGATNDAYGFGTWSNGDIICMACDMENGAFYFRKNGGSWANSGDPTSGSTKTGAIDISATSQWTSSSDWGIWCGDNEGNHDRFSFNFGNGNFPSQSGSFGSQTYSATAVSSAGSNASGIGIFEYDVPTGYTALSTKGLNL